MSFRIGNQDRGFSRKTQVRLTMLLAGASLLLTGGIAAAQTGSTGAGNGAAGSGTGAGNGTSGQAAGQGQAGNGPAGDGTSGQGQAGTSQNGNQQNGNQQNGNQQNGNQQNGNQQNGNQQNGNQQNGNQQNGNQQNGGQQANNQQNGNRMPLGQYSETPGTDGRRGTVLGPNVFDLGTTIRVTLETSSNLEIANRNLQRDSARIHEDEAGFRPRINASGEYIHLDAPTRISIGSGPPLLVQPINTQTLSGDFQLPIDISGQVQATTDQGRLQLMADRFTRDSVYNNLVLSAQTAYFNVLRSQHQVQVAQAALADAQTQLATNNLQFNGGIGQKIDTFRAGSQVATAQQTLLNQQNALALAQDNFNNTVGRPLNAPVIVQDVPGVSVGTIVTNQGQATTPSALPPSPDALPPVSGTQPQAIQPQTTQPAPIGPAPAPGSPAPPTPRANLGPAPGTASAPGATSQGLPPAVGTIEPDTQTFFQPPLSQINAIDVNKGIALALKARPELRADQVTVQADAKQITINRAGLYPTLTLGALGNYYPVTDFQNPRHSIGIFTATVNVPIYDGGLTTARVQEARANQQNAATTFGSDQTTVELQVRQAYLNLYNTANEIGAANSALAQAIAARQLAQLRFANGVALYLEVTDAENALNQAENSQVNAVYDYLIARAQYENAIGVPNLNPTL